MQDETNPQPVENNQTPLAQLPITTGGQKVIQPSPELVQELQAEQQQPPPQPTVVSTENPQPAQPTQPTYSSPTPPDGQIQVGMSASQMGLNQPKNKLFNLNPKKLIIMGVVALVVLGGVFAVLVATNIIALSQFNTIDYVNSKGNHYNLSFYTKHTTLTAKSGSILLVSKVSEGDKFPLILSISTGDESSYARVKDCGSYTKVFDVQNNNLNQKISVCNIPVGQNVPDGVYVAGILVNNQNNIVTISQDLTGTDLSSQSSAKQSLTKFGLYPYQDDIKKIIASIKVE